MTPGCVSLPGGLAAGARATAAGCQLSSVTARRSRLLGAATPSGQLQAAPGGDSWLRGAGILRSWRCGAGALNSWLGRAAEVEMRCLPCARAVVPATPRVLRAGQLPCATARRSWPLGALAPIGQLLAAPGGGSWLRGAGILCSWLHGGGAQNSWPRGAAADFGYF